MRWIVVGRIFVSIALILELELFQAPALAVLLVTALALIPLAMWLGRATEELAAHTG